jgi:hypothetical protein
MLADKSYLEIIRRKPSILRWPLAVLLSGVVFAMAQ